MRSYGNLLATTPLTFAIFILGVEFAVTQHVCVSKMSIGICMYYRESHLAWADISENANRMENYSCLMKCLINLILKRSPSALIHSGLPGVHIKNVL